MGKKKILIVDDEKDILDLLEYTLKNHDYMVFRASDGEEALKMAEKHRPDLVLMDIMMPKLDGIETCHALRSKPEFKNTFILILTARGEEYSEIAGFNAGADDYIIKPIKPRSLMKRLDAIQRREVVGKIKEKIEMGSFVLDPDKHAIVKGEEETPLPKKEFDLLFLLAQNPGKVVSREKILEKVWGNDVIVGGRTIDVHIRRIRQKIGNKLILTIKGVGYRLNV